MRPVRSLLIVGAAVMGVLLCGCGESATLPNLPQDTDYPLCGFKVLIDDMQEPAPHDASAVLRWALAMQSYTAHLRLDREIPPKAKVPHQITLDARILRRDAAAYAAQVRESGSDAAKLDAAFSALASTEFTRAVSDVYGWDTANCEYSGSRF